MPLLIMVAFLTSVYWLVHKLQTYDWEKMRPHAQFLRYTFYEDAKYIWTWRQRRQADDYIVNED